MRNSVVIFPWVLLLLLSSWGCTPPAEDPNIYLSGRVYTLEDGNDQIHVLDFVSRTSVEYRIYTIEGYSGGSPPLETETLPWELDQTTRELTLSFQEGDQLYTVEDGGGTLRSQTTGLVFRQIN